MRTTRLLPVSQSMQCVCVCGGGVCSRGGDLPLVGRGVSAPGEGYLPLVLGSTSLLSRERG